MDFCADLVNVQSIFNYANEYIKPLNKIQFRGGNEPYISDIVTKLTYFFRSKGYVDAKTLKPLPTSDSDLRKITLFLILNTEATFKYDLSNDYTISHLLKTMPSLPKALLHACVWGLSLDRYFCECIAYTPNWFAFQFIENVVDSLKYANPFETLDRVDQLVRAIYLNIARSDFRQMETVDKKIILNKYYDVTSDLLRHFYAPDAEKFQNWSRNKYYKYKGYVLKHNLEMILYCFELFKRRPLLKSDAIEYDIYALMREREPLIDDHRDAYNEVVTENLHKMNTTLLNSLQYNVMQVDVNTFSYWTEIDLDDERSLQRAVGEAAYKVERLVNVNECFQHDVGAQLKTIATKPLTIEQTIAQCTITELIEKLEKLVEIDDANIGLWLNGFIGRGDLVLGNAECLEALDLHTRSLSMAQVKELILYAASVNADDNDGCVEEKLIEICLNSFDHLPDNEIIELISYSIEQQQQHFSYLQLENFDQFLIEVFNKTTFSRNRKTYLKLLFQNPQLFYAKVFEEALTTDVQMQHMVDIVQATAPVFRIFIDAHLKTLIETKCTATQRGVVQLLPKLLAQIFFANIIDASTFVIENLYKKYLVRAMKDNNNGQVLLIINTFSLIANKYKFDGICPPILVMGAQVIEVFRWNILKFSDDAVAIVSKTIDFITEILNKYLPLAIDSEKMWILSKISTYAPLTRYYFQKLSLAKEQSPKTFDDFLRPADFDIENKKQCVKFLCEHVVRCTAKEINWLARNEKLLPCFWDAFHLVMAIVARSKKTTEIDCLRYSCNSFLQVVEKEMFTAAKACDEKIDLIKQLLQFVTDLSVLALYNDIFMNMQSMLMTNIEQLKDADDRVVNEIRPVVDSLPDCEPKALLLLKLKTFSS